jgi:hypothetical protein
VTDRRVDEDRKQLFYDDAQRPMPILAEGEPIKELVE